MMREKLLYVQRSELGMPLCAGAPKSIHAIRACLSACDSVRAEHGLS